jgi:hypothetical protein
MRRLPVRTATFTLVSTICMLQAAVAADTDVLVFSGASDASAAVALDARHFVVADDEDNVLRIYCLDGPVSPVGQVDLDEFLAIDGQAAEADIEGAARIDDRIYWITSHGRNRNGKERPGRLAFFATDVVNDAGHGIPSLVPVGRPYRRLVQDLLRDPQLRFLNLEPTLQPGRSLKKKERRTLAPQQRGFNIEGLAAGPDRSLLIGLRNPTFAGQAIILVLQDPDAVALEGRKAKFAPPILLDAGGLGVRSLEFAPPYVLIAGPADGEDRYEALVWHGPGMSPRPRPLDLPADFTPEAVFRSPGSSVLWLLSDDGMRPRAVASADDCSSGELLDDGQCPNKFLVDRSRRTFRVLPVPMLE